MHGQGSKGNSWHTVMVVLSYWELRYSVEEISNYLRSQSEGEPYGTSGGRFWLESPTL